MFTKERYDSGILKNLDTRLASVPALMKFNIGIIIDILKNGLCALRAYPYFQNILISPFIDCFYRFLPYIPQTHIRVAAIAYATTGEYISIWSYYYILE